MLERPRRVTVRRDCPARRWAALCVSVCAHACVCLVVRLASCELWRRVRAGGLGVQARTQAWLCTVINHPGWRQVAPEVAGAVRVSRFLDPDVEQLVQPYRKMRNVK